ncbi:UNVERIFIED_CONTAM: hypothetical protein Slati_1451800 [Sesamum latifolium]|uniref:Uncharacterized protein n=1 Tax=Sesamum latifolium TaxID=2727402 RepID=A0AAW2X4A8_9LAMI
MNIYWAMAFILPKSIIRTIEARMRKFLWQGGSGTGMAKVAWTDICKPTDEGGQGIRALEPLNRGLMSKHLWILSNIPTLLFGLNGYIAIVSRGVRFGRQAARLDHGVGGKMSG